MQRTKKTEENNIKTIQQIKKGTSNVVVVANTPGSSSLRCCTAIAPLSLRFCCSCCRYAVAPLSHRYRTNVAPLLSLLLLLRSRSCYCLRCRSIVAPLSNRCCSDIAYVALLPLLSLLLSQRYHCCYCSCCNSRSSPKEAESG